MRCSLIYSVLLTQKYYMSRQQTIMGRWQTYRQVQSLVIGTEAHRSNSSSKPLSLKDELIQVAGCRFHLVCDEFTLSLMLQLCGQPQACSGVYSCLEGIQPQRTVVSHCQLVRSICSKMVFSEVSTLLSVLPEKNSNSAIMFGVFSFCYSSKAQGFYLI